MSQYDMSRLRGVLSQLDELQETNLKFIDFVKKKSATMAFPALMKFDNDFISIEFFGYLANAKYRVVKNENNAFIYEYRFLVALNEKLIEVARLYINSSGILFEEQNFGARLSEYNDPNIAQYICQFVAAGILNSKVIYPSEKFQ